MDAPDITHTMLAALASIADRVAKEELPPEQAQKEIAEISPKLAALWALARSKGAAAIMAIATMFGVYYAREAILLGEKQVALAEEQIRLQRDSKADELLGQVLEVMKGNSRWSTQEPSKDKMGKQQAAGPSNRQAPTETSSVEVTSKRKPKARELRRRAEAERRRALNPRPHR